MHCHSADPVNIMWLHMYIVYVQDYVMRLHARIIVYVKRLVKVM